MPEDKISIVKLLTDHQLASVLLLSFWAGTVRYLTNLQGGKFVLLGWLTEAAVSGFVGVVTALICVHYGLSLVLTAAIVGISAHNGTRSLYFMSNVIKKRIK